jgi:hypothetical protein
MHHKEKVDMGTINKITTGFVIQEFDEKTEKCVNQDFVAGDEVVWENEDGEVLSNAPETYFPFNMIQPEGKPTLTPEQRKEALEMILDRFVEDVTRASHDPNEVARFLSDLIDLDEWSEHQMSHYLGDDDWIHITG